jgi:hypothetical protein
MSLFEEASLVITPNGTKASKLYAIKPTSGAGDLTVTRATTATRVNANGLIETVASNVPRIDYSGGGCPSILVEPQRTNICLRSQALATAPWTLDSGVVTNNSVISPDGTINANKLENVGASTGGVYQTITGLTLGDTYTVSFYGKLGTATNICLVMNNTIAWNTVGGQSFTAADGLNSTTWKKFSFTFTVPASIGFNIHIGTHNQTGVTPQSTGTFFVYGVQAEKSSYPTSYIPTTSAAVTRNADVISKTGISSLIGQTEGTLFLDINFKNINQSSGVDTLLTLNNGTTANEISILLDTPSGANKTILGYIRNASLNEVILYAASPITATRYKIALSYKLNDVVLYVNGSQIGIYTSVTIPTTSAISFNSRSDNSFLNIQQEYIQSAQLYKTRLTNTELAELTTL